MQMGDPFHTISGSDSATFVQPFEDTLVAGDTWSWLGIVLDGFDPASYTLKYFFRGPTKLDIVAVPSVDAQGFDITVPGADTSELEAGQYAWQMCVFDASENRTEVARGTVEILADISAEDADGSGVDPRSWVKASLDAVRNVLQGRASRVESEYQINGRMLKLMSPMDLLQLEGELAHKYEKELLDSGQRPRSSNQIRARFV